MTAEKSIKILKAVKELKDDAIYTLTDLTEAYKMAIEALSKQSAISEQADQCGNGTEMVELKKRTITERLIIAESLINSVIADSDNNQFRDSAKKIDSERVSLLEQEKSNSLSKEPSEEGNSEMNCSDVPDIHVGKSDFKPGDKFILELGQERRMFKEFEIAGTDLYVETRLLEKLTRFEPNAQTVYSVQPPEIKPISYHDCTNAMMRMWIDNVLTDGEYNRIMDKLNKYELERRTNDSD